MSELLAVVPCRAMPVAYFSEADLLVALPPVVRIVFHDFRDGLCVLLGVVPVRISVPFGLGLLHLVAEAVRVLAAAVLGEPRLFRLLYVVVIFVAVFLKSGLL